MQNLLHLIVRKRYFLLSFKYGGVNSQLFHSADLNVRVFGMPVGRANDVRQFGESVIPLITFLSKNTNSAVKF